LINYSALEKTVHLVSVPHDINGAAESLFQFLFNTDEIKQVRVLKLNDYVYITLIVVKEKRGQIF